jgi:bacterial/archaeal transporter family-2 protein
MPKEIYYLIALIVGLAVVTQTGVNSQLNLITNNSTVTALISFLVGTTALLIYVLITSPASLSNPVALFQGEWWKYTGGLFGAFFISMVVIIAPKIGAANTLGFIVAGQLIFGVIYDHFGLIGFPVKALSLFRIVGVCLLIAGLYLIRKY